MIVKDYLLANKYVTKNAKTFIEKVAEIDENLLYYYDEFSGDFEFSHTEFKKNINSIMSLLELFSLSASESFLILNYNNESERYFITKIYNKSIFA